MMLVHQTVEHQSKSTWAVVNATTTLISLFPFPSLRSLEPHREKVSLMDLDPNAVTLLVLVIAVPYVAVVHVDSLAEWMESLFMKLL